jgi:DNA-binding response OmpR family regulator
VIELPTITEAQVGERPEKNEAQASARPLAGAHRVLLVEDDRDSSQMLTLLLESQGYPVQVGRSVREAKRMADGCDLIVSDIALPDGSGLELIRDLLQQRPRRAIALSGYGSADDVERSLQAGFSEHLTKPVDLDQLMAALRRLAAR